MTRLGAAIGIALFWLTVLVGGAAAAETGSHAWVKLGVPLYEGPGSQYDVVGEVVADLEVRVERCSRGWCRIHSDGGRGWMRRAALSFGQSSNLLGSQRDLNIIGFGTVCLYTGRNYTGEALCKKSGFAVRDLLLNDLDNVYSSISIEGTASVLLCRDRDFRSYCERVNESQPQLHGFLDDNVSSIHIY